MAALVVVLIAVPALAGLWCLFVADRGTAVTAAAVGALTAVVTNLALVAALVATGPVTVGSWLRFDELSAVLATVVSVLALTVLTYARRNLHEDAAVGRFLAAALGLLASTLLFATAGRVSLLVAAWLLASTSMVGLIGYRRDGAARAAARRAARAALVGDFALALALLLVLVAVGDPALASLGSAVDRLAEQELALGPFAVALPVVVMTLVVVAAAARAAQLPFLGWLTGTLAAPTPVSALLHAGAVNAGAILLIRLGPLLEEAWFAAALLAAVSVATIVVAAGIALVRPDVKGGLAASTSAQMGFMLLAVAVGAPAAALTHLVGHAFYKSSRFLGAGTAVDRAVADRRAPRPAAAVTSVRVVLAAVVPAAVLSALWLALGLDDLPAAEAWLVGGAAVATAVQLTWSWSASVGTAPVRSAARFVGALALLGGLYLSLATTFGTLVDGALTHGTGLVDPRAPLAVLLGLVAVGAAAARHPTTAPALAGWLSGVARVTPTRARRPVRASDGVSVPAPVVRGAW